jgi:CubicO group peptidase (beta-lactamase class C family)
MLSVILISSFVAFSCSYSIIENNLDDILKSGIESRVYTGVAAIAGRIDGTEIYAKSWGNYDYLDIVPDSPSVGLDSYFDLASCSKVLATTSAVAMLYQEGYLLLDSLVVDILGNEFAQGGKETITVRHCLLHNAGLNPDPDPWYWTSEFNCSNTFDDFPAEDFSCMDQTFMSLQAEQVTQSPGSVYVYSDIGFQLLQLVVGATVIRNNLVNFEELRPECIYALDSSQTTLRFSTDGVLFACYFEAYVRRKVFQVDLVVVRDTDSSNSNSNGSSAVLSDGSYSWLSASQYILPEQLYVQAVPTLNDTGDGSYTHKRLQGQVADGDCYAMGGICGHAGVFSTAQDVAKILTRLLRLAAAPLQPNPATPSSDVTEITPLGSAAETATQSFAERAAEALWLNATTIKYFTTEYNQSQSSRALGWTTNDPTVCVCIFQNKVFACHVCFRRTME